MLEFKIKRGLSTAMFTAPGVINPKLIIELGCWYLCTDTAELFIGVLDTDNNLTLKRVNDDRNHVTDEHINTLINDYYLAHPETDPEVPEWAKRPSKPSYNAAEVGAVSNTRKIAGLSLNRDITSDALLDALDFQEEDPTVPSWAKQPEKPTYTAKEVGAVTKKELETLFSSFEDSFDVTSSLGEDSLETQIPNVKATKTYVDDLEARLPGVIKEAIETSVVILKTDQTTKWETSSYIMLSGEVGLGYLDNGNVIAKLGDGVHSWRDLPQIEGVFEDDLTLTYDFGKYKINNGFVVTPAKGKTTSQWLVEALSEVKEPNIIQPTFNLTATATGANGEIGSYLTALNWDGTTTYGEYEYGPETGLTRNHLTWSISNNIDSQKSVEEDGTFALTNSYRIQLTQEASKTYATITGAYYLDASTAVTPVNNVGKTTDGKITDKSGILTADIISTAYRKPFYGVLTPGNTIDISNLTSTVVRNLPSYGTSTKGLPSSIDVPAGSQMVVFAAKADTYKSLVATDNKAMNATVTFEKVAKSVQVAGANGFSPIDYDIWYVDWGAGIGADKQLKLTWA